MSTRFLQVLVQRPMILDAGLGTRLIALGLDLAHDDPAFWNITNPDAVSAIHARDRAAGADAVLTNTFGANRSWLARFGRADEVELINRRAVALARAAVGASAVVIGSVGPTAADLPGAVREQAELLRDAGVDALIFETHRTDQAESALSETRDLAELPRLVSLVTWPNPPDEAARRLAELGADVLGANCQLGMARAFAEIEALSRVTDRPLLVKPGAGRPSEPTESPESFAHAVPRLLQCGVRLLGGCCGTTEAHVAALRAACYDRP